ncbi:YetF domain-containing protein [Chryseobacterium sp. JAH]|uniref:YetF domain-containing protein n=1 Tax=Chryseobacterium sp. JAH TaxID=1742858 RepID=UPI000648479B|nr:YetF domain-containing protein [Chryseobacterium sp. JAH]
MYLTIFLNFSWKEFFLGGEEWIFLFEIVLRTLIMFLTIIISLRVLGKRGVKQLSVFELVVIIGLGSAAGDPMFYKDVGIMSSIIVFVVIILFYSLLTYLIGRFKKIENLLEGKAICLIQDGVFSIDNFKKENLGSDEFFSELRLKGVSHLGQVEMAIEETSGDISVFFFDEESIRYGLPVMPNSLDHPLRHIEKESHYSCTFCGYTEGKTAGEAGKCKNCGKQNWVVAVNKKRIT